MKQSLHQDGSIIIHQAIQEVLPDEAVRRALQDFRSSGRLTVISVGKAAWQMAKAAYDWTGNCHNKIWPCHGSNPRF